MSLRSSKNLDHLLECEMEPIHIPGAIQPFGILLTVDPQELNIQNVSENCRLFFDLSAKEVLGRKLTEFITPQATEAVVKYLMSAELEEHLPFTVCTLSSNEMWELKAHYYLGMIIIELEPFITLAKTEHFQFNRLVQNAIANLQRTKSVQELCKVAATQIKNVTGFDRVMIYQFNQDWHGVVIAETCSRDVDSYLGHHFPAGDIPAQARAIFLQNWLRMIPDANYLPVNIFPNKNPLTDTPLDLGKALLRSVSPIHLQYLKNMNVEASLTISLIREGKLWGLIACHHKTPLFIGNDQRNASVQIGQFTSSLLEVKDAEDAKEYKHALNQYTEQLINSLRSEVDLPSALKKYSFEILQLANSKSVAILYKGDWTTAGLVPSTSELDKLIAWLSDHTTANGIFVTDSLIQHIPDAEAYKEIASGLLVLELSKAEKSYILWFRPEVRKTITWAGAPDKSIVQVGELSRLHPRASFESWSEVVKGKAEPWKGVEIESLTQLRTHLLSLGLEHEYRKEHEARIKAERLGLEKEEVVMMVSHDLRTPLSIISMSFEFLKRAAHSDNPAFNRMIDRGANGAKAMETLISDILDITKIGSGNMNLDVLPEDADSLAEKAVDMFLPLAKRKNIQLAYERNGVHQKVVCEKNRIHQVLNNLISNALKFTPINGGIVVSTQNVGNEVVFSISDNGSGIHEDNLPKIFDRYWQADATKRLGTGLGLWISKSIIEKHGGQIWATSKLESGTKFYFSLPIYSEL